MTWLTQLDPSANTTVETIRDGVLAGIVLLLGAGVATLLVRRRQGKLSGTLALQASVIVFALGIVGALGFGRLIDGAAVTTVLGTIVGYIVGITRPAGPDKSAETTEPEPT